MIIMNIYERLKELTVMKNMSIRQLEKKLGFGNGSLKRWDKNTPSVDKIEKVANYFDVSTDYLLGRENRKLKQVAIDDDIVALTFNGAELSKKERAVILATAQALIEQRESE